MGVFGLPTFRSGPDGYETSHQLQQNIQDRTVRTAPQPLAADAAWIDASHADISELVFTDAVQAIHGLRAKAGIQPRYPSGAIAADQGQPPGPNLIFGLSGQPIRGLRRVTGPQPPMRPTAPTNVMEALVIVVDKFMAITMDWQPGQRAPLAALIADQGQAVTNDAFAFANWPQPDGS